METTDRPSGFDIERLLQMERDVLGPNDHHTYTEMREWISQRPDEQFVLLELSTNNVVSYCLTLRVSGVNRLGTLSFDELKKESARDPGGPVLVIVRLVSYRSEGVVLDAVLEKAKQLPGVESVVAMARCTDVPGQWHCFTRKSFSCLFLCLIVTHISLMRLPCVHACRSCRRRWTL